METTSWIEYMKATEPQRSKVSKIVEKLIKLGEQNKRNTARYTTLRNQAIDICNRIGDDFEDYAGYFGI